MDGVIVLDKPSGWTSHDAVNKVRRLVGTKKVGHLGTLDPMATGVLPMVVGRATRLAQFYGQSEKSYEGVIRFGWATDSYDADGERVGDKSQPSLSQEEVEEWFSRFRGTFDQVPPPVSAKKIGGTPAYKLARKNLPVELAPVSVTISRLDLLWLEGPEATISMDCSAGTYVRAIAHDVGKLAGCGAHLARLVRTRAGDFTLDRAISLDRLAAMSEEGSVAPALIPAAELLPEFPCEHVDALTASQIRDGRSFRTSPFRATAGARHVKAIAPDGSLLAIGELTLPHVYHPMVVL